MNASPITKITSWLEFLGKNLHLVGCATVCGKSEVMLLHILVHTKLSQGLKSKVRHVVDNMNKTKSLNLHIKFAEIFCAPFDDKN